MRQIDCENGKNGISITVYGNIGIILLNVAILFLLCNVFAWAIIKVKHSIHPNMPGTIEDLQKVYPGWTAQDITQLYEEETVDAYQYAPYMGFREKARSGKYVNVSPEGFRYSLNKNASLKEDGVNIYVFGGSSGFGYGVDDASNIPAHMQKLFLKKYPGKKINVFNFGVASYWSSLEFEWFATLMREGHVPNIAVFIDGYNEGFFNAPLYTKEMTALFNAKSNGFLPLGKLTIAELPVINLLSRTLKVKTAPLDNLSSFGRPSPSESVARYRLNKKLITVLASEYGVRAYFFIQPVVGYRNKFRTHLFNPSGGEIINNEMMALLAETADKKTSFDITSLLENYEKQPFVDVAHYAPEVCGMVAQTIVDRIAVP